MATDLTELMAEDAPAFEYETIPTPTTDLPTPQDPDGKYCVVCGTDVSDIYKRKMKEYRCEDHKKNKTASNLGERTRSSSKDVQAAVTTLDSWYTLLSFGLLMGGAKKSSELLAASAEELKVKNEVHLSQAPALAKRIAEMGKTSAMYGFFSAQALVLGPVAILAASELMEKWGTSKNKNPEDFGDIPATVGGFPVE